MTIKSEKNPPIWPVIQRLLSLSGGLRAWLYGALAIDLGLAVILVITNHFNRKFFDAVMANQLDAFWYYVSLALAMTILTIPFDAIKVYAIGRFSERTMAKVRQNLARSSTGLPIAYLEARHSGDMLSVLNADLGKLKTLLQNNLIDLIGQSARGILALAYIISLSWLLTLAAVLAMPLIFLLISSLSRPVSKRSEEMQAEIGQVNSVAQDGISGAMLIKSFNLTAILEERFHQANLKTLQKGLGIARLRAINDGIGFGLMIVPFILSVGLGGYLVIEKQMTFGALFAFINLLNYVVNPLGNLPNIIASISEAAGAARRVFDLVDAQPERTSGSTSMPATAHNAVCFKNVSFGYAGSSPVLKNVSLDIPSGKTIAIVGPSGGGKSTLVKLILGYYPLEEGSLELFGRPLSEWQLSAARQQMAFVAQDTYLFPVSIGENIGLGKPGASQPEIEQAARQANIHEYIAGLSQGYHTGAGEWGSRLSGGQKQRIALARAILKNAPILLLDEPTSALDTESEALVQQALDRFTVNRTTVVIAHRLSTIKNADQVVVLEGGAIVQQGTHDELLAQGGLYLDLYQTQFAQPANGAGEK